MDYSYDLHFACYREDIPDVCYLLEQKADILPETLDMACTYGQLDIVKILVEHKADVVNDDFPFYRACVEEHKPLVEYFISVGVDISTTNRRFLTQLCRLRRFDMIEYLISIGADVTTNDNETICWAGRYGNTGLIKKLIEKKADVTARNNLPLVWASSEGYFETVKFLLEQKADATAQDNYSIVCASMFAGSKKTIEILLENGADINKLLPNHKEYFKTQRAEHLAKMKKAYSKWRRVHHIRWIKRVLIPLYFSPRNRGGLQAKKELKAILN